MTLAEAGPLLLVRVAGSHFLWKMVRRMVGVLVAAGTGALPPARVADWLADRARRAAASRRGSPPRRPDCSSSGSSTRAIAWPEPLRPPVGVR